MADFEKKYIYIDLHHYSNHICLHGCYSKLVIDPCKTYYIDWVKFNAYK